MSVVYRIYGRDRHLLYVGVTDNYDQRMRQHAEKVWWSQVRSIEIAEYASRQDAEAAERIAIVTEQPAFNKAGTKAPPKPSPIPKPVVRSGANGRRWLNLQESADYLGVTDRSIRNYIARGMLPARRIRGSRSIRIDRADLDNLLRPIPTAGGESR